MGGPRHVEAAPYSWCVLCSGLGLASLCRVTSMLVAMLHLTMLGSIPAASCSCPSCVSCMHCIKCLGLPGVRAAGPSWIRTMDQNHKVCSFAA